MSRRTLALWLLFALATSPGRAGGIPPASVAVLLEEAGTHDGRAFRIRGEVVGEPLFTDPGGFWLNLSDQGNLIGVFCPASLGWDPASIKGGRHGRLGDIVECLGTLQRVCPDHAGELDFHLRRFRIQEAARDLPPDWTWRDVLTFWGFLAACLLLWMWRRRWESTPDSPPAADPL